MRPPLVALDDAAAMALLDQLRALGFEMRGYPRANGLQRDVRASALS